MHYLIDGHNLIATMPDIDLADPDDEAQLILRLRQWIAAGKKRRVTVYFDGGLPGGRSPQFSGGALEVIFASSARDADDLIIRKIDQVHNPPEYTLVTADRQIVAAAEARRMPVIPPETFAAQLGHETEARAEPQAAPARDDPSLTPDEVAEWMELFGPEPELPPRKRRVRRKKSSDEKKESAPQPPPKKAVRPADALKDSGEKLTGEEVEAWLEMFGSEPDAETLKEIKETVRRKRREERRAQRLEGRPADVLKESGAKLNRDEVEEWLDIFNDSEAD